MIKNETAARRDRFSDERLIVFTRFPRPGDTKTRLIPLLGLDGAADLQRRMTEHAVAQARELVRRRSVSLEIHYEGADRRAMQRWLGPQMTYKPQASGDIGQRMAHAFLESFQGGSGRVVLIGTDCPGRTDSYMAAAFDALKRVDVVLGPTRDGGYHLIGLRAENPRLFEGIDWGTDKVLSQTLKVADDLGLSQVLLDVLQDVDRPEDLQNLENSERPMRPAAPVVSIIIPTLNEAETIAETLKNVYSTADEGVEVIVVDGGSADGTANLARNRGARVLTSPPGRAVQMNAGAAAAIGEILLFLHADTRLPEQWTGGVRRALTQPEVGGGAFELGIDSPLWAMRVIERAVAWRSRYLRMPYGDQALFVKANVFRELGGFAPVPIMEDFAFVRRLRKRGRVVIVPDRVTTSARRWEAVGPWKTTLINQVIIAAYFAGAPLPTLARWYRRKR